MPADPFAASRSTCDTCGRRLSNGTERGRGRCGVCFDALEAGQTADAARELSSDALREYQSAKVDGRPWWESQRAIFVAAYPDLDALNLEAPSAAAVGYSITSIAATSGQANLGRMAVGFWAVGALGAALASKRSDGAVIVAWALSKDLGQPRGL